MPKTGKYTAEIRLYVTDEMHQFLKLMAERNGTNLSEIIRQAIREHLDIQEDIITSRSRLGRTVLRRLDTMHNQILGQLTYLVKLVLAAVIISLTEQGHSAGDVSKRIVSLANQPALDKMVRGK
jgi:predicted DNA-binding protein